MSVCRQSDHGRPVLPGSKVSGNSALTPPHCSTSIGLPDTVRLGGLGALLAEGSLSPRRYYHCSSGVLPETPKWVGLSAFKFLICSGS